MFCEILLTALTSSKNEESNLTVPLVIDTLGTVCIALKYLYDSFEVSLRHLSYTSFKAMQAVPSVSFTQNPVKLETSLLLQVRAIRKLSENTGELQARVVLRTDSAVFHHAVKHGVCQQCKVLRQARILLLGRFGSYIFQTRRL